MVLNEAQLNRIAHRIQDVLREDPMIELKRSPEVLLARIKGVLMADLEHDAACDAIARKKLTSYSRPIMEGSDEWNILYQKLFDEALRKRGY